MLRSPHVLDHCLMCGLMVRCIGCGTNCCSGGENCAQCADAYAAQEQMDSGVPVVFSLVSATIEQVQRRLKERIEDLPGCVGAETPGWVESETQQLLGDAILEWQILCMSLALSQE